MIPNMGKNCREAQIFLLNKMTLSFWISKKIEKKTIREAHLILD